MINIKNKWDKCQAMIRKKEKYLLLNFKKKKKMQDTCFFIDALKNIYDK